MVVDEVLVGLVSGKLTEVGDKVFPLAAPSEAELPYVTYAKVNSTPSNSVDASSVADRHTYQFTSYAKTFTQARDIATELRATLDNYEAEDKSLLILYDTDKPDYDFESNVFEHSISFLVKERF